LVLKRDLGKHKALLERRTIEKQAFVKSRSLLIQRKKHYKSLIGGERYDDESLKKSTEMIGIDIVAMSNNIKLAQDAVDHHKMIVDDLTFKLTAYNKNRELVRQYHANRS